MLSYRENVKAILETHFVGFKDEVIESAVNRIMDIKTDEDDISIDKSCVDVLEKVNKRLKEKFEEKKKIYPTVQLISLRDLVDDEILHMLGHKGTDLNYGGPIIEYHDEKKGITEEDLDKFDDQTLIYTLPNAKSGDCFHGEVWVKCPYCGKAIELVGSKPLKTTIGYKIYKCDKCNKLFKDI